MTSEGKKIELLPTNFHISLEQRVRAAAGIPAYIRRLRRIEDLTEALIEALDEIFEEEKYRMDGDEDRAWELVHGRARELDLGLLNDLIARHNEFYPIEANLPVDPKTERFLYMGKPWEPLPSATWTQIYDRLRARRSTSHDHS
jgi:hypothetical protein